MPTEPTQPEPDRPGDDNLALIATLIAIVLVGIVVFLATSDIEIGNGSIRISRPPGGISAAR